MVAVGWRSDGRELQVAGGGAASSGARWNAAAPHRNIAGNDLTSAPVRQNSWDKDQKKEGGHEELTEGLGPEEDSLEKEIDGEGGAPVRLPWGRWCRGEEELRGVVRVGEVLGGCLL
jgi:hypothetical protein